MVVGGLLCRTVKPSLFSLVASEGADDLAAGTNGSDQGAVVDYSLARAATLRAWRAGELGRHDVCDAQRELQRNAQFCGQATGRRCPVCAENEVVEVTYAFGSRLPKHGRCVTTRAEIERLRRRVSVSTGYVVEVCTACGWNHLVRRIALGGRRSA